MHLCLAPRGEDRLQQFGPKGTQHAIQVFSAFSSHSVALTQMKVLTIRVCIMMINNDIIQHNKVG